MSQCTHARNEVHEESCSHRAECEIDGCDRIPQLTMYKPERRTLRVCTKCGPEMRETMGWSIVSTAPPPARHLRVVR